MDRTSNTVTVYVDGTQSGSRSDQDLSISPNLDGRVCIGRDLSDTFRSDVSIDQVRVWSRVLSDEEVNRLYQREIRGERDRYL